MSFVLLGEVGVDAPASFFVLFAIIIQLISSGVNRKMMTACQINPRFFNSRITVQTWFNHFRIVASIL